MNAYRVPFAPSGSTETDVVASLLVASDEDAPARAAAAALASSYGLPLFSYEGASWPQPAAGDLATEQTILTANRGWGFAIAEKYDVLVDWIPVVGAGSAYSFYCLSGPVGLENLGLLEELQNYSTPKFDGVLQLVYGTGGEQPASEGRSAAERADGLPLK